jgi:hypothetical protein
MASKGGWDWNFYGDEPQFNAVAENINDLLEEVFIDSDIICWNTLFGPTSIDGTAVNWLLRVYGTPADGSEEIEFVYQCINCTVEAFENHSDTTPGTVFFEQVADVLDRNSFFITMGILKTLAESQCAF